MEFLKHNCHDARLKAVLYTEPQRFFAAVDKYGLPEEYLQDTHILPCHKFPLHYFTACWNIILSKYDEYDNQYKEIAYKRKLKNDQIMDFFVSHYHLDMEQIPLGDYRKYFFRNQEVYDCEWCFGQSEEEMVTHGFRKIDIDLFCAVNGVDYEKAEQLLAAGANPEMEFEATVNCWSITCDERDYCSNRFVPFLLGERLVFDWNHLDFSYFTGWAAQEKMYSLLEKYSH